MMRASLSALVLLFALHAAHAGDTYTLDFTLGGAKAGSNSYTIETDGSIQSTTEFAISNMKITSTLSTRFSEGKLSALTYTFKSKGTDVTASFKNKKWSYSMNGTPTQISISDFDYVYSNYHPGVLAALTAGIQGSGGVKRRTLMLDNLAFFEIGVNPKPSIRLGNEKLSKFELMLGDVKMDVALNPAQHLIAFEVPAQAFKAADQRYVDAFTDPTDKFKELSPRKYKTRTLQGVEIPMRDGTKTVADVVLPEGEGKFPTLLTRTPYGRELSLIGIRAEWWAARGYAVVSQDVRGRGASTGKWDPFMFERKDGYDSIDWISKQPWSDGKVGMIGASYSGMVCWQAAVELHPALKCIVPQVSPPDAFFNLPYDHGTFMLLGAMWWANIVKDKDADLTLANSPGIKMGGFNTLPISQVDDKVLKRNIPFFDEWLKRDRPSKWAGWNYQADMAKVKIPSLMISGWWDGDNIGTAMNWQIMRKLGRTNQWLIYGPWEHGFNVKTKVADEEYGPGSVIDLESIYLRFFDTYLKGKSVNWQETPKAQAFLTGKNEWMKLDGWPSSSARKITAYLSATRSAKGLSGDGTLLLDRKPAKGARSTQYVYDPMSLALPDEPMKVNESSLTMTPEQMGKEFAFFRTAPLDKPLKVMGPFEADLYIESSTKDADFFATLVEVRADGAVRPFAQAGKMRASYHLVWEKRTALKKGQVVRLKFPLWDSARELPKGSRLGIMIRSDMFPAFSRNPGDLSPDATAIKLLKGTQTIHHGGRHLSNFTFYTLP